MPSEAISLEGGPFASRNAIEAVFTISWRWLLFAPSMVAVIAIALFQGAEHRWIADVYFVVWLLLMPLILLIALMAWWHRSRVLFRLLPKERPQGYLRVTFSSDGISLQDKNSTMDIHWQLVGKFHRSWNLMYFRVNKMPIFIAKRELTTEQFDRLRALLIAHAKL